MWSRTQSLPLANAISLGDSLMILDIYPSTISTRSITVFNKTDNKSEMHWCTVMFLNVFSAPSSNNNQTIFRPPNVTEFCCDGQWLPDLCL